jgi:hypothetical protein
MPYLSFLKCEICSQIPSSQGAELLQHESFSRGSWGLKGMPDSLPSGSCQKYVRCSVCKADYLFKCESGCMEYDIYLSRVSPLSLLNDGIITKRRYAQLIQHFPDDLDHKDDDIAAFMGRSLSEHYLVEEMPEQVIELLTHANPLVREHACYAVAHFNTNGGEVKPYVDTLMILLYDQEGKVCDASTNIYNVYGKDTKNIKKYAQRLVSMFAERDMTYHTISILDKIVCSKLLRNVDLTPCLHKMILMFIQKVKYDYFYDDLKRVLNAYVKYSKKNAEAFLAELGKTKENQFLYSLKDVEKNARQKCGVEPKKGTLKMSSGAKVCALLHSYTKTQIIEMLNSVKDFNYRSRWTKSKLVSQLTIHSSEMILSTFTSDDLRKALKKLGLKTSGKKKARLDRLLNALS